VPPFLAVRDFLQNPSKNKRLTLVNQLLEDPRFSSHFATVWRSIILGQVNAAQFQPNLAESFEEFLRQKFKEGAGYDQIVREIIMASPQGQFGAAGFYLVNENKPENVASATSKLFLGVKIECAQCHKHPFAKWSRGQFWEYSAFFSGLQTGQMTGKPAAVAIPGTNQTVEARFLDGTEPDWNNNVDRRQLLANWITRRKNPWFAREAVNRVWEYFFGTGLVEPVDDINPDNPASHPELLDELARQFGDRGFDLVFLCRAIVLSKTYQLTSAMGDPSQNDPRTFARMAVRGMSAEQLYDSLALVTTGSVPEVVRRQGYAPANPNDPRTDFLSRFPNQDRRTETQTSILQALYLMNGKLTVDATTLATSNQLSQLAGTANASLFIAIPEVSESGNLSTSIVEYRPAIPSKADHTRRIQELYRMVLSRMPTQAETDRLVTYLESSGPTGDPKKALADVFWALLNSSEFFFNH
jgi:hypothetical protein